MMIIIFYSLQPVSLHIWPTPPQNLEMKLRYIFNNVGQDKFFWKNGTDNSLKMLKIIVHLTTLGLGENCCTSEYLKSYDKLVPWFIYTCSANIRKGWTWLIKVLIPDCTMVLNGRVFKFRWTVFACDPVTFALWVIVIYLW